MLVFRELKNCLFLITGILEYFLPRAKIDNHNIEIDGRNFYGQPINDSIKHYHEVRKVSTRQGYDYTTGCLLDFAYFETKLHVNCSWFE